MYSLMGTLVYLSMSADATCRGLRSSRDGPLTMELTSGASNSCILLLSLSHQRAPIIALYISLIGFHYNYYLKNRLIYRHRGHHDYFVHSSIHPSSST